MLRLIAFSLVAANGVLFAWSNGYLDSFGLGSASQQSEKHRIAEQIDPDRIVILPANSAATQLPAKPSLPPQPTQPTQLNQPAPSSSALLAANTASTTPTTPTAPPTTPPPVTAVVVPTSCLTAGVFNDKQIGLIKQTLTAKLPTLSWRFETANVPAKWIVYMGKYANIKERDIKKSQLEQIKVRYEVLTAGNLEPGLSLGSHTSQAAANQSLQQLVKQGVRTARVLQESPEQKGQSLIVPSVDNETRLKLNAVYATLSTPLASKTLQTCKK